LSLKKNLPHLKLNVKNSNYLHPMLTHKDVIMKNIEGLVLYTDGGARPNPGVTGIGCHGYRYQLLIDDNKFSVPKNSITTTRGYLPKIHNIKLDKDVWQHIKSYNPNKIISTDDAKVVEMASLIAYQVDWNNYPEDDHAKILETMMSQQMAIVVKPIEYYDLYGSDRGSESNNAAEVDALYYALTSIVPIYEENHIKFLQIMPDSEYLIRGATEWSETWVKYDWKKNGREVKNRRQWERLLETINKLKVIKGLSLTFEWVKGHLNFVGNVYADALASMGILNSDPTELTVSLTKTPSIEYWKLSSDRHPLLCYRKLYFNSQNYNQTGVYCLTNNKIDGDDDGRRLADTTYCIARLYEPSSIISAIHRRMMDESDTINTICTLDLDVVYKGEVFTFLTRYGSLALNRHNQDRMSLSFASNRISVVNEKYPVGTAINTIKNFNDLDAVRTLTERYLEHKCEGISYDTVVVDVTDTFYITSEVKKKTVTKLKPEYKPGFTKLTIAFTLPLDEPKEVSLPILMGTDLPPRNNMAKYADNQPKVYLVCWQVDIISFRYGFYVKTNEGDAIFTNQYANVKYII